MRVKKVINLFLCYCLLLPGLLYAQSTKTVTLDLKGVPVKVFFDEIRKQTGLSFVYNTEQTKTMKPITVSVKDAQVESVLQQVFSDTEYSYQIEDKIVTIMRKGKGKNRTFSGTVVDEDGTPLPGVNVYVEDHSSYAITDVDGSYSFQIPQNACSVTFSFVGMKNEIVNLKAGVVNEKRTIVLQSDSEMDEVVVTGIYSRRKESFTGSSQTYKAEELKSVGTLNLIQSLKTLDPAFTVIEDNQYGSDPNHLPDLEIRGKSSIVGLKEQFGQDPNQPLFILDGFETSLQSIMDLSLDRIATVTILKDAASTAIYGAKAANGVIVVETKTPQYGKLRLSYNGSFDISFADLTDYNLMNAAEKLEYERLAGNFDSNIADYQEYSIIRYNKLLANVRRGVDTYWMSEPLRTSLNQRHFLYAEGGNEQIRYGLGVSYNKIEGVMKTSDREIISGNMDLLYRVGKLTFSNKLTVETTKYNNPVVAFSEYAKANPYYPKRTEDGSVEKWLEYPESDNSATDASVYMGNPLWNDALNSYNKGESLGVRNNFNIEYRPFKYLYIRGRFGIEKSTTDAEVFTSPEDTSFDSTELLKKGYYSDERSDDFNYDGDLTITYGQLLKDAHQVNAVLGASIRESKYIMKGFSAIGFPEGNFTTPGFANQYTTNGKPSYSDSKNRSANFYFNGGYSYKNRYLLDVNFRLDGTSVFGSNRLFTTTWAVGLAWNIHNEHFIKEHTDAFNMLKIRASVGNPGNQSFGSYNTITTYRYNNWMLNNFGTGVLVNSFGDPDLEWQKTIDLNVGFDLSLWERLHINFDYFHKNTDPLLASIGIPLSVGMSSRMTNIGKQVNKGFNGTIKYSPLYKPKERINWTVSLSFRHIDAYYDKIGNKLDQFNNENITKNLTRYYDGGSPTALWAVRSAGIDPATGQEIFITKDGKPTFSYNYDDEVIVGDSNPDLEGVFGNSLFWKGFSCSFYIRYSVGAKAFNTTLYDKVENISSSDLIYNQDKRALYDRWQQPGDIAKYKGISLTDSTPISSRFVQKNDYITFESIRLAYEFPHTWLKRHLGFSGLTLSAYMNDICRFSSIKDERGIDYPFARSFSMAISVNF